MSHVPWVAAVCALPWLGAVLVARTRGPRDVRTIGGTVAAVVVVALAALLAQVVALGPGGRVEDPAIAALGGRPLLGLDALGAVLALSDAIVALAVIVGAPRARDERPRVVALLTTTALILLMLSSLDLLLLTAAFVSLLVPARARLGPDSSERGSSRLYRVVMLGSAIPLAGALLLSALEGWQQLGPAVFDLRVIVAAPHDEARAVLGLLLVAVWFRMGLIPLHGWLPTLTQHGALGSTVLVVASQSGTYMFVRVVFAFFPGDGGGLLPWLTVGGIASALYASVLALVQDDLRRLVGWLSVSQQGLMIVGLCSLEPDGMAGAVVYWVSYGTAVTGLALAIWAVQARTGTARISELGGLVRSCPRLTLAFAAFSVASVGFPGSLGFVAEDLLVHGVLEVAPLVGAMMIVATALNGMALVRALFRTFFGPARIEAPADLRPRELWIVAGLAALAFGLGLWPAPLVELVGLARLSVHL